jgi:multiple sugar transport system permease protein
VRQDRAAEAPGARGAALELARALRGARTEGWGNPLGYAFVAPALTIYLVFNVWPILRGLTMAFSDYRFLVPGSEWSFNGLDNFVEMFTRDQLFWHSLRVGLTYTLLTFPTGLVLSLGVAALLAQVRSPRAAATYRVIAYLPVVLPIAVAMLLWRQLYHYQLGYINYLLTAVFGVGQPPNWLGDVRWALPAVAVAGVWKAFGGDMLLFLIGIYGINRELYEAASIDGANGPRQFWHITLPLLKPIFVLILALNAGIVSATEEVLVLTNGDPADATLTVGLYVYRTAFQMGDLRLGYAASMSLLLGVIHMVLAGLVFKLLRTERA